MDAFTTSGTSPTPHTLKLLLLLGIDLVAWFLFVTALQKYTGRPSPYLKPDPEPWYTDATQPGRARIWFPIGEEDANGHTPILLMTVEANGNSSAVRAVSHAPRRRQGPADA